MPHTPEKGLTPRDTVDAESHGDAQHVSRVQQRRDDTVAAIDAGRLIQGFGDTTRISSLEETIWSKMKVDADIGEA